jgi:hypothetical protein
MTDEPQSGIDLSGLHRELDRLKSQLCRCGHQGTCLACRGFEVVREQAQTVAAAASQPVLMQVAQEAAAKDLLSQLGGLQERLSSDPQLADLMARFAERVQEDLGGPEELEKMLKSMGFDPGMQRNPFDNRPATGGDQPLPFDDRPSASGDRSIPYDDRPSTGGDRPIPPDERPRPAADDDKPPAS